jgi:hypothetical protein
LHEIGHALGLAESSDPDSIMFPELGPENTALDASDLANIQMLYPSTAPSASASQAAGPSVRLMAEAMAGFSPAAPGTAAFNASAIHRALTPVVSLPAH